ncbi:MAG: hypothetical protein HY960_09185 [Ignavibacteriae bacterium]|nr:hypothetical protein [Ignavibacteriota bacterium]
MISSNKYSEYTIMGTKFSQPEEIQMKHQLPCDLLASGTNGKLIVNPVYRYLSKSKEGIHYWRRREHDKWELENLLMMKAMPLEIVLPWNIIRAVQENLISPEMDAYLKQGVIIEVPLNFV